MRGKRSKRATSRGGRSQTNSVRTGDVLKVIFGLIVIFSLAAVFFFQSERQKAIDPETFCNRAGPAEVHVILLDASDMIDEVQAERIKAKILASAINSAAGSRFDVYVADSIGGSLSEPHFAMCNPGAPSRRETLYSDVESRREAFETRFLQGMEDTLAKVLTADEASSSPILESVRSASAASFSRLNEDVPVSITIVSDMVQNSNLARHRTKSQGFDQFRDSDRWPMALVDLRSARIDVLYIRRSQYVTLQGREHLLWWEKYFDAVNGRMVAVDSI